MSQPRTTPGPYRRAGALAAGLLALLVLLGGFLMIADAASGRGPAGAVRAPESRPALVALFGAVRLGIAALGLLGGALLLCGRKPARAWLSGFGGGLAAVSVLEPLLLGVPLGWPAAGGAIAGALVLLLGRAQPAAGEDRV